MVGATLGALGPLQVVRMAERPAHGLPPGTSGESARGNRLRTTLDAILFRSLAQPIGQLGGVHGNVQSRRVDGRRDLARDECPARPAANLAVT